MPDLHPLPDGRWVERYPTHCHAGCRFAPHLVTVGWTGVERYVHCDSPDHPADLTRWNNAAGRPLASLVHRGGSPDHGVVDAKKGPCDRP